MSLQAECINNCRFLIVKKRHCERNLCICLAENTALIRENKQRYGHFVVLFYIRIQDHASTIGFNRLLQWVEHYVEL